MTDLLDLDACYRRGTEALTEPRTDWETPHIASHVAGMCDRESWAQRRLNYLRKQDERGLTNSLMIEEERVLSAALQPFSTETETGFWLGHAVEERVVARIVAGRPDGWTYLTKVPIDGQFISEIDLILIDPEKREYIVDCKSTVWNATFVDGSKVWATSFATKHNYKLQIADYALRRGAVACAIFELDLGGKGRRFEWFDPADFKDELTERYAEVLLRTDPLREEPTYITKPNHWAEGWACGSVQTRTDKKTGEEKTVVKRAYCSLTSCPSHVSAVLHERENAEIAF